MQFRSKEGPSFPDLMFSDRVRTSSQLPLIPDTAGLPTKQHKYNNNNNNNNRNTLVGQVYQVLARLALRFQLGKDSLELRKGCEGH